MNEKTNVQINLIESNTPTYTKRHLFTTVMMFWSPVEMEAK